MQCSHGYGDQPPDRGLGRQAAGTCKRVKAIVRELAGCDIAPEGAGLCALGKQVSDEFSELLLRPGDVFTSMQERRELRAVVLVGNQGVGLEHSFETVPSVAGAVSDLDETFEVAAHLTFVASEHDRFDV